MAGLGWGWREVMVGGWGRGVVAEVGRLLSVGEDKVRGRGVLLLVVGVVASGGLRVAGGVGCCGRPLPTLLLWVTLPPLQLGAVIASLLLFFLVLSATFALFRLAARGRKRVAVVRDGWGRRLVRVGSWGRGLRVEDGGLLHMGEAVIVVAGCRMLVAVGVVIAAGWGKRVVVGEVWVAPFLHARPRRLLKTSGGIPTTLCAPAPSLRSDGIEKANGDVDVTTWRLGHPHVLTKPPHWQRGRRRRRSS
jgi:hypothetical protein